MSEPVAPGARGDGRHRRLADNVDSDPAQGHAKLAALLDRKVVSLVEFDVARTIADVGSAELEGVVRELRVGR